jgi:circadian clock protein KaiB
MQHNGTEEGTTPFGSLLIEAHDHRRYELRLFVTGMTARSMAAIQAIRTLCDKHLPNRYHLDIIDLYRHPDRAKDEQVIAAPTLVRKLPHPLRRLVGDFSNQERVFKGLEVHY